jgi:hypothetical protein
MLKKLMWAAMHSPYFPLVQFRCLPFEWSTYRETDLFRIDFWTGMGWPVSFPWQVDQGFRDSGGDPPPPPEPKKIKVPFDPYEPDYDDIPF